MLERIARTSYRHRWVVLIAWIVTLVLAVSVGRAFAGDFATGGKLPNTESRRAFDLLESRFPARAGDGGTIVFKAEQGVTDPKVQTAMEAMFAKVAQVPGVTGVVSPYSGEGQNQISKDGTIAYAQVNTVDLDFNEWGPVSDGVRAVRAEVNVPGLTVELGGDIFSDGVKPPATEAFGLLAAVFILLVAFGSVLAMGLPIVTALFGIAIGIAVVELLANVMPVPDFTTQVAAMIAIGVGIDYALFIVTRYREFLKDGARPDVAVLRSINTAGRAVRVRGPHGRHLPSRDVPHRRALRPRPGGRLQLAVLLVMLGSITLLPALLGFVGLNIDRFGLPHRKKHEAAAAQKESLWHRWARTVQRRPWPPFVGGLLILVLLAAPFFSLRLGMADAGNQPTTDTTRRAYDLLAEGFGPGFNGPLLVVADQQGGTSTKADVARLHDALDAGARSGVREPRDPEPGGRHRRDPGVPDLGAARRGDDEADPPPALRCRPCGDQGHRHDGVRRGLHRCVAGLRRRPLVTPSALHRSGARSVVPAPARRLPVDPRAAQGGDHELALDRRRVRRDRRGVPVGMAERRVRCRQGRADRGVGADDALRDRVRPLDGLRGLPPLPHQGGVRPHG